MNLIECGVNCATCDNENTCLTCRGREREGELCNCKPGYTDPVSPSLIDCEPCP